MIFIFLAEIIKKSDKCAKHWCLRHWTSGNEGQWFLTDEDNKVSSVLRCVLSLCLSLQPCGPQPATLSIHRTFQGRMLEWPATSHWSESFSNQGSIPCLLRLLCWQADSLLLSDLGSPNQALYYLSLMPREFPRSIKRKKESEGNLGMFLQAPTVEKTGVRAWESKGV